MTHYFPSDRKAELEMIAEANGFTGPSFIGQGLTRSVGSDSYGHYIVEMKTVGKKPVIGIVGAASRFIKDWTDGSEVCSLPNDADDPKMCKPTEWITTYGKLKDGSPKWWYCDANGNRKNPSGWHRGKAHFGWNGASAYRNPSF